ncbi:MAG TPA: class I SAM-dependent methyltransferase [Bryobacteraceae bacterium]|nr:class I SAM-dependent methyltransferase [Bryobacteraceae bacterium]
MRTRIFFAFPLLAAIGFGQTDYRAALASAKQTDGQREAQQRASEIIGALELKSGDRAADIGAGAGYYTARLSSLVRPGGRVYAVEIREQSLEVLGVRVAQDGLGNVVVTRGAADNPHLEEGALDAVLIVDAYHEMPQYKAMLEQIRRALKPAAGWRSRTTAIGRSATTRESQVMKHLFSPDLAKEEVRQAGFDVKRLEDPLLERKPETGTTRIAMGDLWLLVAVRRQ